VRSFLWKATLAATMVVGGSAGQFGNWSSLHSTIPAGSTVVRLQPSGADVAVLALIECPEVEGARRVSEGTNSRIVSADGAAIEHFPNHFSFRVTVSLRKTLVEAPEDTVMTADEPRQFLLKLGFKLRVYHGLQTHDVEPRSVAVIGVPADIPYDERVFRLSFDVENLPVTDRVVLMVLSPEAEPLTHFAFALL
jgi:hypothetical protein